MSSEIYLDNSATTKPYDEVIQYMYDVSKNFYGNPSSLHTKGIEAEKLIKHARAQLAAELKADTKEILFTSGGTESNNLAVSGYLKANPRAGNHIITSKIEHPSVMEVFKQLAKDGYRVDYIPVDSYGVIELDALKEVIDSETALLSFMHTNNETGSIQPIEEISKLRNTVCPSAVLHADAVQAFGKMRIFPASYGIDLMSISSHKIHGPKGVGAIYIKKGVKVRPVLLGGGQETSLRSGTENVPGICGFGLAAEKIFAGIDENYVYVSSLKEHFVRKIKEYFSEAVINSPEQALPYIINVSFSNLKSEVLLHHLEQKNIFVSTGSACSSHKSNHSYVLKAMGVSTKYIDSAIRFSLSPSNSISDIDETIRALEEIIPVISIKHGGKK
ncbi:cysteine desulfurase [Ruminiclostridium sufflavum DSM 19573]|uniref:Cysteine desulfurase n=1 Tax=Ruminiclostridium sufflavum DSM 19573 TaxID=1121337 RepID=A0A318XNF6_9FIRM|nr:cysteine desulfurase family protein [Ruminiclostridium sufflavum]PYG87532.1 cysteine desulfurase [Ruminiclostridium sufflavum DSM 19573]